MAKVTRDTAKRAIKDLFRSMAPDAVIDLTQRESVPPAHLAAIVKIEITAQPNSPEAKKPAKKGPPNEDVHGQSGSGVGSSRKRGGNQKRKGAAKG